MPAPEIDTLIVSDVHLGSAVSLAADLTRLLETAQFRRLVLLGDIFQDLNFSRLTKAHWQLVSLLRKLSNPKRGVEVVWVEGNHDAGIADVMEHLLGVKVYAEYQWDWAGVRCLAVHGHQYDGLWRDGAPLVGRLLTPAYLLLQRFRLLRGWLPRLLDRLHTHHQRLTAKVADGALRRAAHVGASHVFCGHTHQVWSERRGGVSYWNAGSWVSDRGEYITVGDDGVTQRKFDG